MSKPHFPHQHSHAFSLIELLTAISIIAILSALLVPSLSRIPAESRSTKCASNLRQIGLAALAWSNDNGRKIVPVFDPYDPGTRILSFNTWVGQLAPYTGWPPAPGATEFKSVNDVPIFLCTEKKDVFGYGYNYAYLFWIQVGAVNQWTPYAQVTNANRIVMLVDNLWSPNPSTWRPYVRPGAQLAAGTTDAVVDYRHPGKTANVLWVDGHVSSEKKTPPHSQQIILYGTPTGFPIKKQSIERNSSRNISSYFSYLLIVFDNEFLP